MPWCPKCKDEYVEGIKTCVDCGVDLVDELPEETDPGAPVILCHADTPEIAEKITSYLHYGNLQTPAIQEDNDGDGYNIIIAGFEQEAAENMFARFHSIDEMADMDISDLVPDIDKQLEELQSEEANQMFSELRTEASSVYVKKKDKYADLKFSGISFLIFGVLGIAFVIVNQMGLVHFLNQFSTLIMTVVFAAFFIVGISSLLRANKLKGIVSEEEKVTNEVMDWIDSNISDELIASLIDPALSEEDNYFSVHEKLCAMVAEQFPLFSKGYTDELMDERYNDYCESNTRRED